MNTAAQKILVIGGGFSGMAAAIEGARRGLQVDLVELDKDWRSYGAGISLGGPTLRALKSLGLIEAFLQQSMDERTGYEDAIAQLEHLFEAERASTQGFDSRKSNTKRFQT
eukprot:gene13837-18661_t